MKISDKKFKIGGEYKITYFTKGLKEITFNYTATLIKIGETKIVNGREFTNAIFNIGKKPYHYIIQQGVLGEWIAVIDAKYHNYSIDLTAHNQHKVIHAKNEIERGETNV